MALPERLAESLTLVNRRVCAARDDSFRGVHY